MEDILGTRVENILYFIFPNQELLGKHGRKDVGRFGKARGKKI